MTNKPIYTLLAALSIDGKIAREIKHFSDWTSKEDKSFLHTILDTSDVILIGNTSYKLAIEPLSKRNCIVLSRSVTQYKKIHDKLILCNPTVESLPRLIKQLGYKNVCILGGTQTYSYCLINNLIDEMYITIEPIVFGNGLSLFDKNDECNWKFQNVKLLNNTGTILLHYKKV